MAKQKMNWREWRGRHDARSTDGQIDWLVLPKQGSKFFVKAYLAGGASHRLRPQEFDTAQKAIEWAEAYDAKRYADNARHAEEEPIQV